MNVWLQAIFLMATSKKGISSNQLSRMLGITLKSAWFLSHRIREAMRDNSMFNVVGGTVEADATFVGGKEKNKHRSKRVKGGQGGATKECVFSLFERNGKARSFHIPAVNAANLRPILNGQLDAAKTDLMTDGEQIFRKFSPLFASHNTVNHEAGEYVRGDVHTNTIEGFFSILKRGIVGTFHHVSAEHLQRYVTEFDFRYNNRQSKVKIAGKWVKVGFSDAERADNLLQGVKGKRLTYATTDVGRACVA